MFSIVSVSSMNSKVIFVSPEEIAVSSKETCAPLMVADLLAATNSMIRARLA